MASKTKSDVAQAKKKKKSTGPDPSIFPMSAPYTDDAAAFRGKDMGGDRPLDAASSGGGGENTAGQGVPASSGSSTS